MASRLSSSLESIEFSPNDDPEPFVPPSVVRKLLSRFAEGLRVVHLRGSNVDDEAIEALSLSPAAKTIQEIQILHAPSYISDASAHVWQRFSALRNLSFHFCHLLDTPTFMALSKHPILEYLNFASYEAGAPPANLIIPILLAQDSLPSLTSLNIMSNYPAHAISLHDLVELVRRRPHLERFTQLGRAEQDGNETNLLFELHEMCPNLEILCAPLNSKQCPIPDVLVRNLRNVKELTDEEVVIRADADLLAVANRFPHLEALRLGGDSSGAFSGTLDFRCFTNLKSLYLISSAPSPLQLPPCLRDLEYAAQSDQHLALPSDQVTALCLSICKSAPNLKYLVISLPGLSLTQTHATLLLNRLPILEQIVLQGNGSKVKPRERLEICHPNVNWVSVDSIQLSVVPRWWPNKKFFSASGAVESLVGKLQPLCAPNLRRLNVWLSDDPTVVTDRAPVKSLVDAISVFDRQITSLTLDTHSHCLSQDSFESLVSLRYLSRLEIRNLLLTQENAQTLVSTMPLLTQLDINFVLQTLDASWLAFAHLRFLTVSLARSNETNPEGPKCDPGLFVLRTENLPLLTNIILNCASPSISGVLLSGFEHLGDVEVISPGLFPFQVCVSKCKFLFSIIIRNALLSSIQLSELPSLVAIRFRTCRLHDDAILNVSECPRLRHGESCKHRASPAAAEKCIQFEEAILLQTAHTEHLRFE
jgi:hypothetical protein